MAEHGGKRPGAGRPKGAATRMNEQARKKALESGQTPLEYMLEVMRDPGADEGKRLEAAKAAAPYVHAKLSAIELSGGLEHAHSVRELTRADLERIAAGGSAGTTGKA